MEQIFGKFGGYTMRGVSSERDATRIARWMAKDEFHQHLHPAFFLGLLENADPDPRPNCLALQDYRGEVMFYIRIDRAARVNIQFDPNRKSMMERSRVGRALINGMAFLEVSLSRSNVSEWIFDTTAPSLKDFAETRMNFRESPFDLVRLIPLSSGKVQ